jgi:CheY-like chemotaxis protein
LNVSEFNVLLVDDDPDILSISKLAMRDFTVYGLPINLVTATSKADAVALFESAGLGHRGVDNLAVAFIDVVMETDTAGLELCQYIREVRNNKLTQLFVRTGQPGIAPEREVMDRYDINGYLSKVEATEDKLYSFVKSGVRQCIFTATSLVLSDLVNALIAAQTRAGMLATLNGMIQAMEYSQQGERQENVQIATAYEIDGEIVSASRRYKENPQEARDLLASLGQLPPKTLNAQGDTFVQDGNRHLYRIAQGPTTSALAYFGIGTAPSPDIEVFLFSRYCRSMAELWKRSP